MLGRSPLADMVSSKQAPTRELWIRRVLVRSQEGQLEARLARWLKERYADGREAGDGKYVVTFKVADAAWSVREVLQYGAEAEVLEPEGLREAVKRAVGSER